MGIHDYLRYLNIGLPEDVLRLKYYGDFEGAIQAIDRHLAAGNTPDALKKCLAVHREILLRQPADYPLPREDAIKLLRSHIPDFTESEFDALVSAWKINWIYVQGVPHYFNRFYETLCKTDKAFANRAGVLTSVADGQDNGTGRLDRTISRMKLQGSCSVRIRCRASVRMKDEYFKKGDRIRAYLPIPCACASQSDIQIEQVTPRPTLILPETAPQRVVFWEEPAQENHAFSVEFSYVQTARYVDLSHPEKSFEQPSFDTEELPPHVMFTPYIKELTRTLSEGAESPLEKARRFYDFITQNINYSFMPAYFCLENIPEVCARNRVGDCGVMALLFITLCRCAGIPARWQSGWKADPDFCGAHDWAQFYAAPYGWLYADPSFGAGAVRDHNEERRQFYFGNLDPYRMVANTQFQADYGVPKDYWREDPYDNQVGEMETQSRGLDYAEFERTKEVLSCEDL